MNTVRELRIRAGMQQKELALMAGVSRPTVSEWEHNKKDPSGDRLKRLSEIFNVDPGVILGYTPKSAFSDAPAIPRTTESAIISECVDSMTPEDRQKALAIFRAAFTEIFEKMEQKMA